MNRFFSTSCVMGCLLTFPLNAQQKIAFTWDDLPVHGSLPAGETRQHVIESLIGTIKANHMPAPYGFVNAKATESEPGLTKVLDAWRAAGFPLGNHTWSHMNLNASSTSVDAWNNEVVQNEPVLRKEMGAEDFHWFRFPNLSEGNTADKRVRTRHFLAEHAYKIAGVTMSFADYAYNEPYARCMTSGDDASIKSLEDDYLREAVKNLNYAHQMSFALYGREIPYILLMHVGAFDARMLTRLLGLYRQHGAAFVSLQEASTDAFYKNNLDLSLGQSPDTLEDAMQLRGLSLPSREPSQVDLNTLCIRK